MHFVPQRSQEDSHYVGTRMTSNSDQHLLRSLTAMIAAIGRHSELYPETRTFEIYPERLEVFAQANGVDDSKRLQTFLTMLAEKAYVNLAACYTPEDFVECEIR